MYNYSNILTVVVPLFISTTCMLGWGVENFLMAKLSRGIGAIKAGFLIQFFALLLTILFVPLLMKETRIDLIQPLILGFISAITFAVFCKAISEGNLSLVMPITQSWALITAFLGIIFFHEAITLYKILSIIFVVSGVITLSINWNAIKNKGTKLISQGVVAALFVAFGWGVSNFWIGIISRQTHWYFAALSNRFFTVLFLGLIAFFTNSLNNQRSIKLSWKLIIYIVVLDFISFTSYNLGMSRFEVSYVSIIASASPLVSVFLAGYLLKEKTLLIQKIGIAVVILGIILLQFK